MKKLLIFSVSVLLFGQLIAQEKNIVNKELETSKRFNKNLEYDSAYIYAKKALAISKLQKNDSLTFASALALYWLSDKKTIQDSTDYFTIAAMIAKKNRNPVADIELYYSKGDMLYSRDEFADALPLFLKIDSLSKAKNIKNGTTINALIKRSEISRLKFTEATSETAEKLLMEALKMAQDIKSDEMVNLIYIYLADTSGLNEKYDEAKKYIDLAFQYYLKIDDVRNVSRLYLVSTAYYLAIDDLDSAKKTQADRLAYLRTKNDPVELASALAYNGSFHRRKTKDLNSALRSLEEANKIYKTLSPSLRKTSKYETLLYHMAMAYSEKKEYDKAFNYLDLSYDLRDELVKKRNIEMTSSLETKYEAAKKEKEIAQLIAQKTVAQEQKKNQRYLFLSLLSIGLIVVGLMLYAYRNKLKTAQKLKELDAMKSKFFANISHEFRTPLTLISSPIDDALEDTSIPESKRKQFTIAKQNSERLLALVNQLLDLSKIDAGHLKLHLQEANALQLLSALCDSFSYTAKQKNIDYQININQNDQSVWFDKDAIEKITVNLVSNALKYTPDNGSVVCNASTDAHKLILEVKNTGKGLTNEESETIFERFYQTDEQNQGTGIGLALVKELVELHKGTIEVTSVPNEWTSFKVIISVDKNNFKNEDFLVSSPTKIEVAMPQQFKPFMNEDDDDFVDSEHPILLIVEDNDDLRNLLKYTFEQDYNVITAPNGVIGVELALEHIPDLIISDVMMPEKDGISLANDLKGDERSAHIPIILLTAKAGTDNQFEGIDTGADDYITKPFDKKLLSLKVKKLIESRKLLQSRYSQELILTPKDIAFTNLDEKFLEKLQNVLDNNLMESTFSVEQFSKALGMSRMQLHRKLKALTGLSATEFVRSQRLKLAASLLKRSDANVSEIGYMVGFNDPSYFTKCFKEAYGCLPSDYSSKS